MLIVICQSDTHTHSPASTAATITMRSAEAELQNTIELRATPSERLFWSTGGGLKRKNASAKIERIRWKITIAALMQPFQYYLRDPAAKDNSITHAAAAPSNLDAAIAMRFAASRRKPARIYARGNTRWQQSCSYSNAICNHGFKKRKELRTQEQPRVAGHRVSCRGGRHSRQKRPQPHPPHTRGNFHRRLQPLYTETYKVSCSGFLPNTSPMQHSFSHYHAFCSIM